MKRNAVAVAVGALFIAPAAQAQIVFGNDTIGTVQFYGKLYPQFGLWNSTGATAPASDVSTLVGTSATNTACPSSSCPGTNPLSRQLVEVSNSYIGFRGERNLGSLGLKAIWQIETATNFDVGTGTWASRNSFVGLSGSRFGTVKLGNMDTVYKEYGDPFGMFGISSGNFVSASNVLSHIGIGTNRLARFHERRNNSVMYETPQFAGFQGGIMYGPAEDRSDTREAKLWSYGVKWNSEQFYFSVHQERHYDFFGASVNIPVAALKNDGDAGAHSKDTATRASGEVRLGDHRVTLDVAQLEYKEFGQSVATARFSSYKHSNWAIGWEAKWGGPWGTAVQYIRGGQGTCQLTVGDCSTTGLKGQMLTAGVRYTLDKQTFLYGIAARLTNDVSARYSNFSGTDPNRGGDVTQAALGISYTF